MNLIYKKSESTVYPELLDTTSSKTTVYLRKNVEEKLVEDEITGETKLFYEYDEAKLSKDEYEQYMQYKTIQQQRADIDYIALMTGVDLEEI